MLGHICRSISSRTHKHAGKRRAAIMNKTSADATRLTAPPALHWARDRRALHPRRHGPTRTFEGFFFLVVTGPVQILIFGRPKFIVQPSKFCSVTRFICTKGFQQSNWQILLSEGRATGFTFRVRVPVQILGRPKWFRNRKRPGQSSASHGANLALVAAAFLIVQVHFDT